MSQSIIMILICAATGAIVFSLAYNWNLLRWIPIFFGGVFFIGIMTQIFGRRGYEPYIINVLFVVILPLVFAGIFRLIDVWSTDHKHH